MSIETPPHTSLLRSSLLRRRPDPAPAPSDVANVIAKDVDPEPLPHAVTEEAPNEVIDATVGALASEIARRRVAAFERLDAEISARRAELMQALELQRAEADRRAAEADRLEREAMARRREQADRVWATEQPQNLAERLNGALTAELVETRRRYEDAETRLQAEFEGRRREEAERLEAWRRSERERIEAEMASEEQRFSERLMRQLEEFEFQLGERQREHEERLEQWWDETEQLARQRVAALLDEMFSKKGPTSS
jgi:hypothetical protein